MDAKGLAQVKQLIEQIENEDGRLDEGQKGVMRQMIAGGMDEVEAKTRVLCIGHSPENMKTVPIDPNVRYPRMVYHKDGRMKVADDEANYNAAVEAGWVDKPLEIHVKNTLKAAEKREKENTQKPVEARA